MRLRLPVVLIATALLQPAPLWAADVPATSEVTTVTVFPSGAEVTRSAKVNLEKGEHVVVLGDVPPTAVPGSIRVEGKATGEIAIGSVDTSRKILQRAESAAADVERKTLEDNLEKLRDERAIVEAEARAADTQQVLLSNLAELPKRPATGGTTTLGEDWPRVLSIISQGTQEAGRALLEANRKLRDVDHRISDIEKKLSALAPPRTEQTEVRIHVEAKSPLEADFTVRYQVPNAGWSPIYDARLNTGTKTEPPQLELARRAAIEQRTGEAWKNVDLVLSTSRPAASAAAPVLEEQSVDFEPPVKPMPAPPMVRMEKSRAPEAVAADAAVAAGEATVAEIAEEPKPIGEITSTLINAPFEATFNVPGKVTIADDGEVKRVLLQSDKLEPKLSSRSVPRLEPNSYLYATFKFDKGTPLLPGLVYLFRDDSFTGTGDIPLLPPGEEHHLGFGVDDLVKVRYAVLEEKRAAQGLISTSQVDTRNYRVTVKNLHERPIDVAVFDRVPTSRNDEIKVEYIGKTEPTRKDVDEKRGVIAFEQTLAADAEQVFEFGYRITWPASKSIIYGP